ncbi:hypothetical protein NDU88_001460 [Pleurodeles waltl]|uniref:Uncharacterized protein n=1 Tax=Pleurodeles waltl TaxID=8319 RepID=A0AAV7MUR2_PLEWA|nr:hypothetical protein NDU88_001460 [Pleurodeles waltl]
MRKRAHRGSRPGAPSDETVQRVHQKAVEVVAMLGGDELCPAFSPSMEAAWDSNTSLDSSSGESDAPLPHVTTRTANKLKGTTAHHTDQCPREP